MKVTISGGPMASGMTITGQDGKQLAGVTRIALAPIVAGEPITAEIDVDIDGIDVAAEAFLSLESLESAAAHYGLQLVQVQS